MPKFSLEELKLPSHLEITIVTTAFPIKFVNERASDINLSIPNNRTNPSTGIVIQPRRIGLQYCAMSPKFNSDLLRMFNLFNFARIDFFAVLLTDGVNPTNLILCLLFLHDLGLKVYPKKSNDVSEYNPLRFASLQ